MSKHNQLKNNLLTPGQVLRLPTVGKTPYYGQPVVYKVKSGDTLSAIAQKFTLRRIFKKINNIRNSNKIRLGQIIKIRIKQIKRKFRVSKHQILAIIRAERRLTDLRGLPQMLEV